MTGVTSVVGVPSTHLVYLNFCSNLPGANELSQQDFLPVCLASSEPQDESPIANPAYVKYAPCPCDLTERGCDINCCCDQVQERNGTNHPSGHDCSYSPGTYQSYQGTTVKPLDISCTLLGNKIIDHSDVVGASPVSTAPTTSSFST